jgi:asparagine synthase (glutamine-hydrolysing)
MCGIAGLLGVSGDPQAAIDYVSKMTASLTHRGPDDAGFASGDGWAIGMRRLAVQDTSQAGHQPMTRGDLTIVFNGEVYNFPELREDLAGRGYSFSSGSDTEVVLNAFRCWGTAALSRFNGMFALAILDPVRGRAWLARDRFGKKPLFIARLRRGVAFASELKAILAVAGNELSIDRSALADYFRFQYVPYPQTIFSEVEKLPPATWTELHLASGARTRSTTYWALPEHEPSRDAATPEEVLEVVQASVRRRLIADVPVGAFLSGGIDSSLVVACMCDAAADVHTFSIGFEDPRFDESRYAKAVARYLGSNHTNLQLGSQDALRLLPELATAYDEPFADSSAIPTMAVSRLARLNVTVALSGDGGDELFGGYTRYQIPRMCRVASATPVTVARTLQILSPPGVLGRGARAFSDLAATGSTGQVYREFVSIWKTRELRSLMPETAGSTSFNGAFAARGGPVERMMRCDARTYLIDDILQKVDRASMSVGLEARNPLLDPDVVEAAMRSTALAEAAPGLKPLLRGALELRLPRHLLDRPKKGFGVPVGEWMRQALRPMVEDLVLGRNDAEYDVATAHRLCCEHLSGARDATPQLWSLLVYEIWRERWLSGASVAT